MTSLQSAKLQLEEILALHKIVKIRSSLPVSSGKIDEGILRGIIQNSLWDVAQQMITNIMLDAVKCTNVILQQQLAKNYVEFECKEFEYLHDKYGSMILQTGKLITYGYLDALCKHLKVDYKTQKDRWDIFDLSIHQAAKEVFDELIFLRREGNSVNLFDSCVKLDMNIRQQKKIF